MDELKLLIEMVKDLPAMALYVLIGFWMYKVIVIGSLYGVIKLGINKIHDVLVKPEHERVDKTTVVQGIVIDHCFDDFMVQINRMVAMRNKEGYTGRYIHQTDVDWLRDAITEKIERDKDDG